MSREDIHETYEYGNVETVELGIDHLGNKQWYTSTREGWQEIGSSGCIKLSSEYVPAGTKIEYHNVLSEEDRRGM